MYTWGIIGDINQQDDMGLISLKIRWPRNLSLRPATDWASSVGPNRGWTASMAQGTTSSLIFSKYGYQWLPYGRVDRVILGKSWTTNSPHIDELYSYGSIPINIYFSGVIHIHKSQLFWCEQKRGTRVLTHCHGPMASFPQLWAKPWASWPGSWWCQPIYCRL